MVKATDIGKPASAKGKNESLKDRYKELNEICDKDRAYCWFYLHTLSSVPDSNKGNKAGVISKSFRLGCINNPIVLSSKYDFMELMYGILTVFDENCIRENRFKIIYNSQLMAFLTKNFVSDHFNESWDKGTTTFSTSRFDFEYFSQVPSYTSINNEEGSNQKYTAYPLLVLDLEEKHIHDPSYSALAWIRINEN